MKKFKRILSGIAAMFLVASMIGCTVSAEEDGFITVPVGVEDSMLEADYWADKINRSDKEWTAHDIEQFNEKNKSKIKIKSGKEVVLSELEEKIDGQTVKELYQMTAKFKKDNNYILNGEKVGKSYFDGLEEAMDMEAIKAEVDVKFGFAQVRTTCQQYPTRDKVFIDDDRFFDEIVRSDVYAYMPLAVVGESADKNWYFCIFYGYVGWLEKENVALCVNKTDWESRQEPENFLVVTGAEARFAADPYDAELSGKCVDMGTKLKLADKKEIKTIDQGRKAYGCFVVSVPKRGADGYVEDALAFVPKSEDVTIGYLKYSSEALVDQAFKMLGRTYGWGGDYSSVDCSGFVRMIYSCFGFKLPRVAESQVMVKGVNGKDLSNMSKKEKSEVIKKLPAGSLLYFNGHIMLLLGSDKDDLFVINSVSMFYAGGDDITSANEITVNSLKKTKRANKNTWLEEISYCTTF